MEKVLKIEGMSCNHCVSHVTKTLLGIDGVTDALVSLDEKTAKVTMSKDIDNGIFAAAIDEAGFELV